MTSSLPVSDGASCAILQHGMLSGTVACERTREHFGPAVRRTSGVEEPVLRPAKHEIDLPIVLGIGKWWLPQLRGSYQWSHFTQTDEWC